MTKMDLFEIEIKGVTGKIVIWVVGSVGTAIVFVMVAWFNIVNTVQASETRIMSAMKDGDHKKEIVDTLQNRDIRDLRGKLATIVIK